MTAIAYEQASPSVSHQQVGLTQAEVQERIARGETNDYEPRLGRTYIDILRDNLLNLFNLVLGTLLIIVISYGDYATAFFAGFGVVTNSFFGTIQEIHAKLRLDRLASLGAPTLRARRDGEIQVLDKAQAVKDDIILIEPGDKLVVDGIVLESNALEMNESLLTGESDAIVKDVGQEVYSGSFVIAGTGVMVATKVGANSNINRLSSVAKQYKKVRTPTQEKVYAIVEVTVMIMLIILPMMFFSGLIARLEFLDILRNAVVFVTSLVPQGMVLITILSLTISAIRISLKQTLVQRVNAVESLANVSVLCFDKTGTLTHNDLRVTRIIPYGSDDKSALERKLYTYLQNLTHLNHTASRINDYVAEHVGSGAFTEKTDEVPFSSARKWGAIVLADEALVLGAPERIFGEGGNGTQAREQARQLAANGSRVLGFGWLPDKPDRNNTTIHTEPIALVVLRDRIREGIDETLNAFREEGIRLKVISGDSYETVRAVAEQVGIDASTVYTGAQLDAMSDAEIENVVVDCNVYARIDPETKRRIVQALNRRGEYTAMVGDGVNDVAALKAANLAIVMNDGTQISKDVADLVLLNNAMTTLPLAFREGKETTQTVFGTMKMFLVKNFYNVLLFLFIGFMSLPFPITPVQISWSAFGTVNLPSTLIAFGWIRPSKMRRFRRDVMDYIITVGTIGASLIALLYVVVYVYTNGDVVEVRSVVSVFVSLFGMMIVWNVQGIEVFKPRSFIEHWRVVLLTLVLTTATILSFFLLPDLFEFRIDDIGVIFLCTFVFLLLIVLTEYAMRYRYLLYRLWMLFEK